VADDWLTQEQAAERLHVALDTMRRYVREGRFARTKVGKRYLIPARAIEEFLQSGLQTGPREVVPRAVKKKSPAQRKR
jgi:excisionase family DNA binding protein